MLITEAQKKQIIILISLLSTLLIYILGIAPMQTKIEVSKSELSEKEAKHQEMQAVIGDKTIEVEYIKLREEYENKFQQRFANFDINEKIEAVTKELDVPIQTIRIQEFEPINPNVYENYIAQPKTQEEMELVRADEKTPVFALLLSSRVDLRLEIDTLEDEMRIYDAFNNIIPAGPGDADPDRYCIMIPTMNLKSLRQVRDTTEVNRTQNANYSIYVFAMETLDLTEWDAEFEARKQGEES